MTGDEGGDEDEEDGYREGKCEEEVGVEADEGVDCEEGEGVGWFAP